ncbi:MAG: hypothetical protein QOF42_821, partial [Gammaproteobacteria bacterium]|nr:hypothetical protein [Gammaproteobacteria bacterium]
MDADRYHGEFPSLRFAAHEGGILEIVM